MLFGFRGPQNVPLPSKYLFRKIDPKTVISLPRMGKCKKIMFMCTHISNNCTISSKCWKMLHKPCITFKYSFCFFLYPLQVLRSVTRNRRKESGISLLKLFFPLWWSVPIGELGRYLKKIGRFPFFFLSRPRRFSLSKTDLELKGKKKAKPFQLPPSELDEIKGRHKQSAPQSSIDPPMLVKVFFSFLYCVKQTFWLATWNQ